MLLKKTTVAGVLLAVSALAASLGMLPRHAGAVELFGGQREDEAIAELKKRVARLEAEVAEMRKALLRAGGATDSATEIKNVTEVAKLRAADLLQRAQNTHAVLREVAGAKLAGPDFPNKINDLNNNLTALWMTAAGYGLGRDPYLDNIQLSNSGFSRAKLPPDHGIPGPYVSLGLPRLHERFLEASGIKGKAADKKTAEFQKLVQAYANPAVYQHREFGERAYSEYREGKGLFTPEYRADLKALDQWLTDLEARLDKVPAYFQRMP
jgi:cell division septum initiation protein DivIVA